MSALLESANTPPMREFNVSNTLLGNRAALDAAWERDGYWFFRDMLDKEAVDRLRAVYLKVLNELGVIEPGRTDAAIYNGANLDNYPIRNDGQLHADPLLALNPMRAFVAEPTVRDFFTRLLGDEPYFVPNTEYHAVPPRQDRGRNRFNFLHQDGANNKGLPLKVCWIPLALIDDEIGGLALTEGLHKPRPNDFPRPPEGIAQGVIPADAWRRTTYRPGDLLVFSMESPHSGLANYSDRYFRLSVDVRVMKKSENVPMVGKVDAVDAGTITICANDGRKQTFRLDESTFCRILRGAQTGMPLQLAEIPQRLKIGDPVFVASDSGKATFIRPQH